MKSYIYYIAILTLITSIHCNTRVEQNAAIIYPPGGYDYPKSISNKDTDNYLFTIKNLVPRKDSFLLLDEHYFFEAFNEPNLSIKFLGQDIFRLNKSGGLVWSVIITIVNNKIIIKKATSGSPYPDRDAAQLTKLERLHYRMLEGYFPLEEGRKRTYKQAYMDSMIKVYPQLLNSMYYSYLRNKAITQKTEPFNYSTKVIEIDTTKFKSIINQINNTGFWSLPYKNYCEYPPNDGWGYMLEANTKSKYNIVIQTLCESDTSALKKVCDEIMRYAEEK